jgi:galactokinase
VLCLPSTLLHLSFHPKLHPVPLPLPKSLAVVITNSLAPHALTNTAPEHYNLRVVEVLIAARILATAWGVGDIEGVNGKRIWFKEVLDAWARKTGIEGEKEVFEQAILAVHTILEVDGRGERGWTREEMIESSGMSREDFTKTYLEFLESNLNCPSKTTDQIADTSSPG